MQGVSESGIGGQGLAVFVDGLAVVAFGNMVERGVVVRLGAAAGFSAPLNWTTIGISPSPSARRYLLAAISKS